MIRDTAPTPPVQEVRINARHVKRPALAWQNQAPDVANHAKNRRIPPFYG